MANGKLTSSMIENPEDSDATEFLKFVSRIMSLQKQLDSSYHGEIYLRDRLLKAVDIKHIKEALRDGMKRTSQQVINRVANRLSEKLRTAGTLYVHYTNDTESEQSGGEEALYT